MTSILCVFPLAGDCTFRYTRQPPSTTKDNCNPFDNNQNVHIIYKYQYIYQWIASWQLAKLSITHLWPNGSRRKQINRWRILEQGFQKLKIYRPTHKFLQSDQDTMTMIFLTRTTTPVFLVSTGVRWSTQLLILNNLWWEAMCSHYYLLITTLAHHCVNQEYNLQTMQTCAEINGTDQTLLAVSLSMYITAANETHQSG